LLARIVAMALLPVLLAACASPRPPESAPPTDRPLATTRPTADPTPAPSLPTWFGEALVVVGFTGEFLVPATRTEELPAWTVVWSDGVVVTTVGPRDLPPLYSSTQLTDTELAELQAMLGTADLVDYVHVPGDGDHVICRECNDVVIQLDVEGRFVEIIVPLLRSTGMGYPLPVLEVIRSVRSLEARAARSETVWSGSMPTIMAAPLDVGG
jgi:hypothetical protein